MRKREVAVSVQFLLPAVQAQTKNAKGKKLRGDRRERTRKRVDSFPKYTAEIETEMAAKSSLGTRQTDGKNLVWFGEIERKLTKLSIPTFTYRSSSKLFYGANAP